MENNREEAKDSRTAGAVLPLVLTVLPLDLTVLPQMVAPLLLASGTKKIHPGLPPQDMGRVFGPEWYYRCRSRGSTALEW